MDVGNERAATINMLGIIEVTFVSSWKTKPDVIICLCPLSVSQERSIGGDSVERRICCGVAGTELLVLEMISL